jgi:hypothetical protein
MTKATYALLAIVLFCVIGFTWAHKSRAASETAPTPIQKIMRARIGWLKAMSADLKVMKYEPVVKDARALAAQTHGLAQKLTNPDAKSLTMKVSGLAMELADAAAKKDGATAGTKFKGIEATCNACHAKFRKHYKLIKL